VVPSPYEEARRPEVRRSEVDRPPREGHGHGAGLSPSTDRWEASAAGRTSRARLATGCVRVVPRPNRQELLGEFEATPPSGSKAERPPGESRLAIDLRGPGVRIFACRNESALDVVPFCFRPTRSARCATSRSDSCRPLPSHPPHLSRPRRRWHRSPSRFARPARSAWPGRNPCRSLGWRDRRACSKPTSVRTAVEYSCSRCRAHLGRPDRSRGEGRCGHPPMKRY
jgi:hypothetical protein